MDVDRAVDESAWSMAGDAAFLLGAIGCLGPPVPTESLLRYLGAALLWDRAMPRGLHGVLLCRPQGDVVVLNDRDAYTCRRFSAAHEAGHLLYHKRGVYAHHDGNTQTPMEREANRFAATMLMPEAWIRKDWHLMRSLPHIARRYAVSREAMLIRLRDELHLLPACALSLPPGRAAERPALRVVDRGGTAP